MTKKKKSFSGINIGSASMLLIFIILCLVSFATLSIVSANADKKLSEKIARRTQNYYKACNSAEEALAELDNALQSQYADTADRDTYFKATGQEKSYTFPISETQILCVDVEIFYPTEPEDTFYEITGWHVLPASE